MLSLPISPKVITLSGIYCITRFVVFHFTSDYSYDVTIKSLTSQISRCDIPAAVREHVTVTSWLHEEGTAIEIAAEREPRGKYTLLQSGDLVIIEKLSLTSVTGT
jgi:hypothetical protein